MNGHSDLTLVAEYLSLTHTYILWWIDDRTDVHIRSTQNSLNPPSYGAWKQNNDYLKNLMAREFIFLSKESQLTPKKEKKNSSSACYKWCKCCWMHPVRISYIQHLNYQTKCLLSNFLSFAVMQFSYLLLLYFEEFIDTIFCKLEQGTY